MRGHQPTVGDIQRLQEALALVTAYDAGVENRDFEIFGQVVEDVDHPKGVTMALAQLAWLFLRSMEATGTNVDRADVMAWYGKQFAEAVEELSEGT